jgi:hypothetical protein
VYSRPGSVILRAGERVYFLALVLKGTLEAVAEELDDRSVVEETRDESTHHERRQRRTKKAVGRVVFPEIDQFQLIGSLEFYDRTNASSLHALEQCEMVCDPSTKTDSQHG